MKAVLFLSSLALASAQFAHGESPWRKEVVYQIFERSFYDSNGDKNGDFRGIAEKIPYLKRLGVTAILVQPIFKSGFYHNYFADSFMRADPSLGGTRQFFSMVRSAHRAHLKVILDMEPQYVAEKHPWYNADDKKGLIARRVGIFNISKLPTYTGKQYGIATVNLRSPKVIRDLTRVFSYWAAPNGNRNSGVDGFRIDHMMDDLDDAHVDTNLLTGFWAPLEAKVRKVKPDAFFVAEQSNWASLGEDLFAKGKVDSAYAIPLRAAFVEAVTKGVALPNLVKAIGSENRATPSKGTNLIVIEDHDVPRYASLVKSDPKLLRLGAAFQFALRGTPSIYYGQELGMKGTQLHGPDDGNDIPVRLAFRWRATVPAKGEATWYGQGPWNKPEFSASHDGISVAEQGGSESLLNFYRRLIQLRKSYSALTMGSEKTVSTGNPQVLGILRTYGRQRILALFNFGPGISSAALGKLDVKGELISGYQFPRAKTVRINRPKASSDLMHDFDTSQSIELLPHACGYFLVR